MLDTLRLTAEEAARLLREKEVSGAELDDGETRLNLSVALRVQSLLGL